ncbi:hypothetical protein J53TS2_18870 [Paenibacillus sp. J53TS2]|nr:hypothetical protein J53TS2_18870 [Paenibacillus sp. J53TS2]
MTKHFFQYTVGTRLFLSGLLLQQLHDLFYQLNNTHRGLIIKYVELFERYRSFASAHVIDTYQELIGKLKQNDMQA